jgi:hypothetical protein
MPSLVQVGIKLCPVAKGPVIVTLTILWTFQVPQVTAKAVPPVPGAGNLVAIEVACNRIVKFDD